MKNTLFLPLMVAAIFSMAASCNRKDVKISGKITIRNGCLVPTTLETVPMARVVTTFVSSGSETPLSESVSLTREGSNWVGRYNFIMYDQPSNSTAKWITPKLAVDICSRYRCGGPANPDTSATQSCKGSVAGNSPMQITACPSDNCQSSYDITYNCACSTGSGN